MLFLLLVGIESCGLRPLVACDSASAWERCGGDGRRTASPNGSAPAPLICHTLTHPLPTNAPTGTNSGTAAQWPVGFEWRIHPSHHASDLLCYCCCQTDSDTSMPLLSLCSSHCSVVDRSIASIVCPPSPFLRSPSLSLFHHGLLFVYLHVYLLPVLHHSATYEQQGTRTTNGLTATLAAPPQSFGSASASVRAGSTAAHLESMCRLCVFPSLLQLSAW